MLTRNVLTALTLAIAAAPSLVHAQAQNYPSRPIRIIVPSSPGGGLDFVARATGQHLTAAWGQSVVIDNRAGAGGTIGPDIVAKAPPDGHTLLIVSATFAVNPSVYQKLPYDSVKDFSPIVLATVQPQVLVVHPSVPARNVKDFVALAKSKPGSLNYSSPGDGTLSQLVFELFKSVAGVDIVHIPYKGAGLSMTAVVGGETQASTASAPSTLPHVVSGRLRAIASTGPRRSPAIPDVPTMTESGLPGATITGWFAFLTSPNTPRPIVDKLNAELTRILNSPQMKETLAREGSEPSGGTPEQLKTHLENEISRLAKLIKNKR
jgi:tripartite-type tricarboxylate transporter receptor subunit TctC